LPNLELIKCVSFEHALSLTALSAMQVSLTTSSSSPILITDTDLYTCTYDKPINPPLRFQLIKLVPTESIMLQLIIFLQNINCSRKTYINTKEEIIELGNNSLNLGRLYNIGSFDQNGQFDLSFLPKKISNDFVFIFDFYARPINSKKLIGEVHIRLQVVNEDLTNEKNKGKTKSKRNSTYNE